MVLIAGCLCLLSSHEPAKSFDGTRAVLTFPTGTEVPGPSSRLQPPRPTVDAALGTTNQGTGSCRITVTGKRAHQGDLVVALFGKKYGGRVASRRVPEGIGPHVVEFTGLPAGTHAVRLARYREDARCYYADGTEVEITPGDGPATASVSYSTHSLQVQFELVPGSRTGAPRPSLRRIPVWLRRRDAPLWRYRDPGSQTIITSLVTNAAGRVRFEDLGPGSYTLHTQGFDVLPADRGRLTFEIAAVDRPLRIRGQAH